MIYDRSVSVLEENGKRVSLIGLTVPILMENIFLLLYGTVNTVILSGYKDAAVSAIGVATQIINLTMAILSIVSKGAVIVSSVALGGGNRKRAADIAGTGTALAAGIGLILAIILNLFSVQLMTLMGLSGSVQTMASQYLGIVALYLPISALLTYFNNMLICNGYSKITMLSGISSNVINLVLCSTALYSGISLPVSGVEAVAICGAVAQGTGLVISVLFFFKKQCLFCFAFRRKEAWDILRLGAPAGMSLVSYSLSTTVTTGFITGLGVTVINTKVYVSNILSYTSRFSISLANAGGILMGRHRGAHRMDAVKKLYRQNLQLAVACNTGLAVLAFLFHKPLLSIFTDDPAIFAAGGMIMAIDFAVEATRAINHISEYALNANGDVKTPLITATVSAWCCNVLLSYVFAVVLGWGLIGLWLAMIVDEAFKATVYLLRWKSGRWQLIKI